MNNNETEFTKILNLSEKEKRYAYLEYCFSICRVENLLKEIDEKINDLSPFEFSRENLEKFREDAFELMVMINDIKEGRHCLIRPENEYDFESFKDIMVDIREEADGFRFQLHENLYDL